MDTLIVNFVFFLLILVSIITWTVAFMKYKQMKQVALISEEFNKEFWNAKNWKDGEKIANDSQSDLALIAQEGFSVFNEYSKNTGALKYAGDIRDALEPPLHQETQKILRRHERGLAELASIGSTAPFIGLFGTVWGIMNAMKTISESGQATIDVVAGPVGEALIATAIGIAAALPAVIFYNYFVRKMKIWTTELDTFNESFIRLASRQIKPKKTVGDENAK
jgi:biopolymer transport protein ExbB